MGRAAVQVDVQAVGLVIQRDHVGAQFAKHVGRDPVGRAVGAVEHYLQPVQARAVRDRALAVLDVAPGRIIHAAGLAQFVGRHVDHAVLPTIVQPLLDASL